MDDPREETQQPEPEQADGPFCVIEITRNDPAPPRPTCVTSYDTSGAGAYLPGNGDEPPRAA